ncbi:hypothetical protein MMC14_004679 [Varicellaria rhodocarpa]|nr:hypothetical protein [Varicellaria rhodocarpa]
MEIQSNTSVPTSKLPTISLAPLLESFVPGLSVVSSLFSSYYNVDITHYLSIVLLLGALSWSINYSKTVLWGYVQEYFISTAEIRLDDEMFNYLMYWVSKQNLSKSSARFVAGTKTNSDLVYASDDSDDGVQGDEDDEEGLNEDFDKHWTKLMQRDKIKTLHYTPSNGMHIFRYKGRFLAFTREKNEQQIVYRVSQAEQIYISCLGRNSRIIKDLLEEAQRTYMEKDGTKTVIHRGSGLGMDVYWVRCLSRPPRPLSTVVLDEGQKQMLTSDMREYLHPRSRRWYSNRGIPYRRGYLLTGPPGTGKTSLCFALAGLFSLSIYVVSLNAKSLTEDSLATLFRDLPWRCIVLLEDIDAAGLTNKRSDDPPSEAEKDPNQPNQPKEGAVANGTTSSETPTAPTPPAGISLSAFLNIIDGVASGEGRILVMTTNHIEKLDPALLRPGRVDMTIGFGFAETHTIRGLFKAIYVSLEADKPKKRHEMNGTPPIHEKSKSTSSVGTKTSPASLDSSTDPTRYRYHGKSDEEIDVLATEFSNRMPSGEFTPAEIQGYLLKYKRDPEAAIEKIEEWMDSTRLEGEKRKLGEKKAV